MKKEQSRPNSCCSENKALVLKAATDFTDFTDCCLSGMESSMKSVESVESVVDFISLSCAWARRRQ